MSKYALVINCLGEQCVVVFESESAAVSGALKFLQARNIITDQCNNGLWWLADDEHPESAATEVEALAMFQNQLEFCEEFDVWPVREFPEVSRV